MLPSLTSQQVQSNTKNQSNQSNQSNIKILEIELDKIYQELGESDSSANNIADRILLDCKNLAHQYLANKETVKDLPNKDLLVMFEFLMLKHNHLKELKENLQINEFNEWGFTELGQSLTLHDQCENLGEKFQEVLYIKLAKDINFVSEQIQFCYAVLNCIIRERKIFKQ